MYIPDREGDRGRFLIFLILFFLPHSICSDGERMIEGITAAYCISRETNSHPTANTPRGIIKNASDTNASHLVLLKKSLCGHP